MLLVQSISPPSARREFHWDWHKSQYLFAAPPLKDMNGADKAALAKAIELQIGPPDPRDPAMSSEDQVRQAVMNANIRMIGLNQDEKKPSEVVAQVRNFCSPTGNCTLWFFRKTSHGYELLLDAIGQSFIIQGTATNGFSDLVVNMRSSATDRWLKVYRYARGRYWRVACYDAHSAPLENGVVHQPKEPRISPLSLQLEVVAVFVG
ncbi:MAG: hypothetical protein WBD73_11820 [Candidatus Acidiferrales bacterium]